VAKVRTPAPGAQSFRGMSPGAIAIALTLKYIILAVYAIHATWALVPSFVDVGGPLFSLVWSSIIGLLSLAALGGVARTWFLGRARVEKWTTALLVLGLLTYSVVLWVRATLLGNAAGVAVAWIPAALCAFPLVRYYYLVWREGR
jgi:cellulose synthase/poly-beta-1,6-N-acetylglucosamine synthase-like glycosyltransferase